MVAKFALTFKTATTEPELSKKWMHKLAGKQHVVYSVVVPAAIMRPGNEGQHASQMTARYTVMTV